MYVFATPGCVAARPVRPTLLHIIYPIRHDLRSQRHAEDATPGSVNVLVVYIYGNASGTMRFGGDVDGWDDDSRPLAIRGACAQALHFAGAAGYLGRGDEDAEDVRESLRKIVWLARFPTMGRAPRILALKSGAHRLSA